MIVYVLTASYTEEERVTPPETYVFRGEYGWDEANRYALYLIAEYVAGEWEHYREESVQALRRLVEEGHNEAARRLWNTMSTYQLELEDVAVIDRQYTTDFRWPKETS